ncbi:putative cytochrome c1 heme lyase [Lachnellula hyalina]|uniref:Holocytochrome c-type synthase n=1 Tax=Lachnellula hyalina TaxID=1316788 RepID=A0A8H8RAI3_9HELO|nr:putative cytochrome c1 heme lyase [Lachnellula hyalina]TVY30587.1 putative cytochrome c1 heme lyase [Lachnellula hyalina]
MSKETETPAEVCPVDPATRAAWLKTNKPPHPFPDAAKEASLLTEGNSCDSSQIDQSPPPESQRLTSPAPPPSETPKTLGQDREVSTIPRASPVNNEAGAKPANSERESGVSASGNWVYPSEKMFFEAMKRKGYSSEARDMKTIVPIHNAVNERAWKEIKEWERPWGAEQKCGGPRLHSFLGLSTTMSPKARMKTIFGYIAPFDRHDWVVDRCGTRVEYIIDFYAGKNEGKSNGKLNFYLDVRPKLNTWEGWKMRAFKTFGLV